MRVVDTSAWVEWVSNTPLRDTVATLLPPRSEWLVPSIVRLELLKWLLRVARPDLTEWVMGLTEQCIIVPLDFNLADEAALAWDTHKLATADAVIYATAQAHNAELLTCDRHFEGLPGVIYVPKSAQ